TISVKDIGGQTATIVGSTVVADAPLTKVSQPSRKITILGGRSTGPQVLAVFSDANPRATLADFPASRVLIHWGDGTTSFGTVQLVSRSKTASIWRVIGAHTYAQHLGVSNSYTVTVS